MLASSLLSSTKIQSQLADIPPSNNLLNEDLTPLLQATKEHSLTNTHRLGIGVTAFPFHDPAPELQSKNPLLGIRIDICNRTGRFNSPFYLFCIRSGKEGSQELRIHRHTIPALVPLQEYERHYLPISVPEEGHAGLEEAMLNSGEVSGKQDLHGLVGRVRHDLVAWRLRQDGTELLRDELEIPAPRTPTTEPNGMDHDQHTSHEEDEDADMEEPAGKYGICELSAQEVDARQIRIVWADDRVGRLRISDDGRVIKAAVIGLDGTRLGEVERILMDQTPTLYNLGERLEKVHRMATGRVS